MLYSNLVLVIDKYAANLIPDLNTNYTALDPAIKVRFQELFSLASEFSYLQELDSVLLTLL